MSNNVLTPNQFGFRRGHSTSHAINFSAEFIKKHTSLKQHVIGVFIDLSKAFDTIDHTKLLYKLQTYGIRGNALSLLTSYLSNRVQYTSVLGEDSPLLAIQYGVPQGSVLGPLLFLLYINDLTNCTENAYFILYADDTNIFICGKTHTEAFDKANEVLTAVNKYMHVNQLHINLKKSHYIHFKPSNYLKSTCARTIPFDRETFTKHKLYINGIKLKQVTEIKFLGIILNEELNWQSHIDYLCKKLKICTGVLSRIRHSIPKKHYCNLYHTLFESHLQYCINVWGGAPISQMNKLFLTQKKCIRILFADQIAYANKFCTCARIRPLGKQILGSEFYEKEHTKPIINNYNLLTIYNLYHYHSCIEIFKIMKFRTPISLYSLLQLSTRKQSLLLLPQSTNLFVYQSSKIWNKIRSQLGFTGYEDFSLNVTHFKKLTKSLLLSN